MEDLYLVNQVCFPLYAASKEIIRHYIPLLKPLNLTYTQYLVMLVLWEKKKTSVKELGNDLCLDSGTLTPLLKKLAEKNYINRQRETGDERIVNVTLTAQGAALQKQAEGIPQKIKSYLPLEQEELDTLEHLTRKMLDNFHQDQKKG
ncbi:MULTISPECIES: MarR family winged helix-turn-helix transcriptional regulator [Enterococcus]|uniref:MarR family winged helix-turn-helix transcriptional regulator n=1 Tax=Enterococcus TaxID=1350 RepID=UPI00032D9FE1|nr:MarR family transcriptional regulator [Enterococcus faecium]EGP5554245.1 MarR family transcriptional regulator [Enterococcus faecium]EME3569404.1 MarR family transcriptional regulator [Enterococcus faecium]EOG37686.1 DNA-binding transcriptional repressor MarR [Enterococcus faecium EnGen0184]EOM68994.1 DNA-binding transcriptional repressor MarR [Enterococcus faecium EnGen0165]KAA9180698.1 MarR family transcriptional regulator [Enterococcus faecium]